MSNRSLIEQSIHMARAYKLTQSHVKLVSIHTDLIAKLWLSRESVARCENIINGNDCGYYNDCCDCGIDEDGCGCSYCFSCNACDVRKVNGE